MPPLTFQWEKSGQMPSEIGFGTPKFLIFAKLLSQEWHF